MITSSRPRHPLTSRHLRQIGQRPRHLQARLLEVWGVSWRPGGNRTSFLGNLYRPLGAATMMVQWSYPRREGATGIGLLGLRARLDPARNTVHYDDVRLLHDFHRTPFVGARGRILDPRDNGPREPGNGSWVQLALEVDALRHGRSSRGHLLPAAPQFPAIYYGYAQREQVPLVESDALVRRAADRLVTERSYRSLGELGQTSSSVEAEGQSRLAALAEDDRQQALRSAWEAALVPPTAAGNNVGLWLLPQELTPSVYGAVRALEYFGDLVGAWVHNPTSQIAQHLVANPAQQVASAAGLDLAAALATLAAADDESEAYRTLEAQIVALLPAYRKEVGASDEITDEDLLHGLCGYDRPVAARPAWETLPAEVRRQRLREALKPHLAECCADEDLEQGANEPLRALFAAGLCRIQVLAATGPQFAELTGLAGRRTRERATQRARPAENAELATC